MEDEVEGSVRTSIRSLYLRIIATFSLLLSSLAAASEGVAEQLPPEALEDQIGYFRLWAGNNGAHRYGYTECVYFMSFVLTCFTGRGGFPWTISYGSPRMFMTK